MEISSNCAGSILTGWQERYRARDRVSPLRGSPLSHRPTTTLVSQSRVWYPPDTHMPSACLWLVTTWGIRSCHVRDPCDHFSINWLVHQHEKSEMIPWIWFLPYNPVVQLLSTCYNTKGEVGSVSYCAICQPIYLFSIIAQSVAIRTLALPNTNMNTDLHHCTTHLRRYFYIFLNLHS